MLYGMDIQFLFEGITEVYLVTRLAFLLQPSHDVSFLLLCINGKQKWIVFEKLGFGTVEYICRKGGLFCRKYCNGEIIFIMENGNIYDFCFMH